MKKNISPKFREHQNNKWLKQEEEYLLQLISQRSPESLAQWDIICTMMHERGSRRSLRDYKDKYKRFLNKQRQKQGNLEAYKEDIYRLFQQGKNPKQILQDLDIKCCTSYKIRNILIEKFTSIKIHLKKIVGASKVKEISIQDNSLFKFIKEENLELLSFQQFKKLMILWKQAKKNKNQPQIKSLDQVFKTYNDNLHNYHKIFYDSQKEYERQTIRMPQTELIKKSRSFCDRRQLKIKSKLSQVCTKIQQSQDKNHQFIQNVQFQNVQLNSLNTTPNDFLDIFLQKMSNQNNIMGTNISIHDEDMIQSKISNQQAEGFQDYWNC